MRPVLARFARKGTEKLHGIELIIAIRVLAAVEAAALIRIVIHHGWTVEMQVKAAKHGLKCTEVPVSYRKRIGTSKVSGTIKGSVLAGYKIIGTILREKFKP